MAGGAAMVRPAISASTALLTSKILSSSYSDVVLNGPPMLPNTGPVANVGGSRPVRERNSDSSWVLTALLRLRTSLLVRTTWRLKAMYMKRKGQLKDNVREAQVDQDI